MLLSVGQKAPYFTLQDKDGNTVSISDFLGKKVVLYFYPHDNTTGCTRQACGFANQYDELKARGVEVIGISRDGIVSHSRFALKYNLPHILLSNPERDVIKAYGVWQERKLYGKNYFGLVRTTYIIDENGYIIHVMPKVNPATNAKDVIEFLDKLQSDEASKSN